jgi:MFS transporter, DHA1 family, tetracycline resistance protein
MLAFGLVIPDIQIRGDRLGAHGWMLGLLIASYSIAQLITAPLLGRWSDRIGRRKILLVTTALASVSFLFYGFATAIWIMLLARVLQGVAGANIGVAYAYIADVTKPEARAKSMGLIGMAFGLGFILGPVVGAKLVTLGGGEPLLLGYVAAGLAAINFLYVLLLLPDTRIAGSASDRAPTFRNVSRALATPGLGLLLGMFFALSFGFSNLESTFFLLVTKEFRMTQEGGALVLVFVGVISAIMQGGVIRWAAPRFGEAKLLRFAFLCQVPALALIPFAPPWIPLLTATLALGVGMGLAQPSLSSLISRYAPSAMQGGVFGVMQGLGALARVFGPLVANTLFAWQFWAPYAAAASIVMIPLVAAWWVRMPDREEEAVPAMVH